jgi:predicted MFS family arabinose efflux permease
VTTSKRSAATAVIGGESGVATRIPPADGTVWANHDFRLIWASQTLSDMGTGVSQLGYPLLMLAITGSPAQAGALSAVRALPYLLFGLPAGALADRWNRKRMMIWCDAARALVMLTIPVALLLHDLTPAQLYVTGFLGGVFYVFFSAAESGALPNVVSKHQLPSAVAAQQTSSSASAVVAPPVGGSLFAVTYGLPFLADAVSFLISAGALRSVRAQFQRRRENVPAARLRDDVLLGVRWLSAHPVLRIVALTAAGLQLAISGVALVVIVSAYQQHASPATIGLLLSTVGIGGIGGAALAARIKGRLGFGPTLLGVVWFQAALWVLFAASHQLLLTAIVLVLFAAAMPVFGVASLSYRLAVTPDELLGRVSTAFGLTIWAATPIGAGVAGVLLERFSPTTVSLIFATWVAILGATATATGALRRVKPS